MPLFKVRAIRRDTYETMILVSAESEAYALDQAGGDIELVPDDEWKLVDVEEPTLIIVDEGAPE